MSVPVIFKNIFSLWDRAVRDYAKFHFFPIMFAKYVGVNFLLLLTTSLFQNFRL